MERHGRARRSVGISTSLTRTRTFPIFIYDPRARLRGKLDGKSFAAHFREGPECEMRAGDVCTFSRGYARAMVDVNGIGTSRGGVRVT